MIFKTERLMVRELKNSDSEKFYDLMSNPNVMNPIPQKPMTRKESEERFTELISLKKEGYEKRVWALNENNSTELIGFCALIKNDENENEIAYRLREKYWGKGYGTEITRELIKYSFEKLNFDKLTADVNIDNIKSVRILEKFMNPVKEFYNKKDNCTDRRYEILKTGYNNTCDPLRF